MGAECIEKTKNGECMLYSEEIANHYEEKKKPSLSEIFNLKNLKNALNNTPLQNPQLSKKQREELTKEINEFKDILKDPKYFSEEEIIDLIKEAAEDEIKNIFDFNEIYDYIKSGAIGALVGYLLKKIPWVRALRFIRKIKDKLFKRKKSKERRESIYGGLVFSGYAGGINGDFHKEIKFEKVRELVNKIDNNPKLDTNLEKYNINEEHFVRTINEHLNNALDAITTRFLNGDKTPGKILLTIHVTKKGHFNILVEDNGSGKKEVTSRLKRSERFDHLYCGGKNIGRKNIESFDTSHNKLTFRPKKTKALTQIHRGSVSYTEIHLGDGMSILI